ncbi:uncharacterized protein G2W53_031719 [Senna tora]|uniref:Uncharacterized protein n=1 Tax=Senna tora TaxID=362788 RepID=A0A834SUF1_9FABA|nr:uncharacterized protein G2W53_031719 [Senna tora]
MERGNVYSIKVAKEYGANCSRQSGHNRIEAQQTNKAQQLQ